MKTPSRPLFSLHRPLRGRGSIAPVLCHHHPRPPVLVLPGGRRAALLLLSLFIFHFSLFTSAQADAPPHDTILLGDLDLAEHAEILRNQFRRITPGDFPLVQDIGTFPAVFEFFSPSWNSASAIRSLATWLVPFSVSLENGLTVTRNDDGNILWQGPVDFSRPESADVTIVGTLVAEDDFPLYEAARNEIARRLSPPLVPRSLPSTNVLRFTSFSLDTNGILHLDLASPIDGPVEIFARPIDYVSSVATIVWTNDENTVVTNTSIQWNQAPGEKFLGRPDIWTCLGLATIFNGVASFSDPAITNDDYRVCFYLAQPFADSDSDGLSDASERWTFHTNPHVKDSDGDGWTDGEEITTGTDPLDRLSAPRLARGVLLHAVKYGGNASSRWLQLHSSAPRPVDLSGFRIQSAGTNWTTQVVLPQNTWLAPGHFLLVGGIDITNADITATLDLSASLPELPTAGIRLTPPEGATNAPVDTLFYGTHIPFNEQNLDTAGWLDPTTNLWAAPSRHLERWSLGLDSDHEADWRHATNPPSLHNSDTILDSDGDGLTDEEEYSGFWTDDIETDPLDWDSDGDGLSDGYELRNNLKPYESDSDGNDIPDGDEPAGGDQSHAEAQIAQGVSVDWTPKTWPMGTSIGADGNVRFSVTDVPDMGVWVILREGGHEPEDFSWAVENADILYSASRNVDGGFKMHFLWLLPSTGSSFVLSVSDASNGQVSTPGFEGPDITAHFMAVDAQLRWDWEPVSWLSYQRLLADIDYFPPCFVSLTPEFNDWDECRVAWRLQIAYSRANQQSVELFPSDGEVLCPPGVWFDFADVMGPTLRGGTATVSCRPENSSHIFQHVFYIRGTNPDNASVEAMFTGQPWYALGIARWESNYPKHGTYWQFNETGDLGPLPTNSLWCPNWGYPDGWGIMQLDPPPSPQHMWDWRANVTAGLARMVQKRQEAETYLNTQITQQLADNPEDTLASHVFTIGGVDFQVGTSKTPLEACAIQAYNGATHFVIYWKRKTATEPGSWEINPTQTWYIEAVLNCLELP